MLEIGSFIALTDLKLRTMQGGQCRSESHQKGNDAPMHHKNHKLVKVSKAEKLQLNTQLVGIVTFIPRSNVIWRCFDVA